MIGFFWCFFCLGFFIKISFYLSSISIFIYFVVNLKDLKIISNYFLSIIISLVLLTPHFLWLFENNFITIFYGLDRSGLSEFNILSHLLNPLIFLIKQMLILIPFFTMLFVIVKKFKFSIGKKNKKTFFLISINLIPFLLIFATSVITSANIRTMWMTPFYLFLGVMFIDILRKNIELKKIKKFYYIFLFLFILSPSIYLGISIFDETKRTDYPGKEISRLVQNKWNDNFVNEIKIVIGDEWSAGNLSYHLTRPVWFNSLKDKTDLITDDQGVIYAGNPTVLKKYVQVFLEK